MSGCARIGFLVGWWIITNTFPLKLHASQLGAMMAEPDNFHIRRDYWLWFALILACSVIAVLAILAILYSCGCSRSTSQPQKSARHLTFITVNDVYRPDGVADGTIGGLHRLRTLRKRIESETPNPILLHAGDFLGPSLISKVFKGKQMIDIMNRLDGDAAAFDERMFVVFGNHEFDDSRCNNKDAVLDARVAQSQFRWLNSNLDFSNCPNMESLATHKNVINDGVVLSINNVKLGLFGIGLTPDKMDDKKQPEKFPSYGDELIAARNMIKHLRRQGAEFVVAVTHLDQEADQKLIDQLGEEGLNLVVGGHDHNFMELKSKDGLTRAFKADADARTAWRIDVEFTEAARPSIKSELIQLDSSISRDPDILARAKIWLERAETDICIHERKLKDPDCLSTVIGSTQEPIELDEGLNRSGETGFGSWLADLVRAKTGADVAFVNSGTLGLNENLDSGTKLRLRHIADIFRFDGIIAKRSFSKKTVCEALEHGFKVPGKGAWPHISGVKVEIENHSVKRISIDDKEVDCKSEESISVAALTFALCGNDGFPFKLGQENAEKGEICGDLGYNRYTSPAKDPQLWLSVIAEDAIRADSAGIRPLKTGRVIITQSAQPNPGK